MVNNEPDWRTLGVRIVHGVVSLDIRVVEEPKEVYWVDPIHPDPEQEKNQEGFTS